MAKLKRFTEDEIDTIINMYPAHHNYEIAKVLNRNPKVIGDKIHRLGLKGRPPASTLRTLHMKQKIEKYYGVDIEWLLNTMHWILDIPIRNGIDKLLDISPSTVKEWMTERNIKTRNISQDNDRRYKYMSKKEKRNQVRAANKCIKHGEDSPNWKGGVKSWRGTRWDTIRKQIKERDNYTCQHCGVHENESKHTLHVHHKVLYRLSKNNEPDNLITLCNRCHTKADAINLKNYKYNKEMKIWKQNKLNQYV